MKTSMKKMALLICIDTLNAYESLKSKARLKGTTIREYIRFIVIITSQVIPNLSLGYRIYHFLSIYLPVATSSNLSSWLLTSFYSSYSDSLEIGLSLVCSLKSVVISVDFVYNTLVKILVELRLSAK